MKIGDTITLVRTTQDKNGEILAVRAVEGVIKDLRDNGNNVRLESFEYGNTVTLADFATDSGPLLYFAWRVGEVVFTSLADWYSHGQV